MPRPKRASQERSDFRRRLHEAISRSRFAPGDDGLDALLPLIGVHKKSVLNWIDGKSYPEQRHLGALARALNVPVDWLRSGHPAMPWEIRHLLDMLDATDQTANPTAAKKLVSSYPGSGGIILNKRRRPKIADLFPGVNKLLNGRRNRAANTSVDTPSIPTGQTDLNQTDQAAYALGSLFGRRAKVPFAEMQAGDGRRLAIGYLFYLRRLVRAQAQKHQVNLENELPSPQVPYQGAVVLRELHLVLTGALADALYRGPVSEDSPHDISRTISTSRTLTDLTTMVSDAEDRICNALQRHWGLRRIPLAEPKDSHGIRSSTPK